MKVTMLDVARSAGVDKGTVSRALNGDPRVAEKTRLRIMDAVQKLGYRLNRNARILSTSRSGLVGVVVREMSAPWFARFAAGLDRVFSNTEYELMFKCTNGDVRRAARELNRLQDRNAEGVIWCDEGTAPQNLDVPFVTLGFQMDASYSILSESGELIMTFETGALAGRVVRGLTRGKAVPRLITVRNSNEDL